MTASVRTNSKALATTLRHKIQERKFSVHEPLPSLRNLAARYGVGVQVVRSALARLQAEGLVYSLERRGTFVRLEQETPGAAGAHSPLRCINFIERASGTMPGFVRSGYLQGYTEILEHLDVKMRILPAPEGGQDWTRLFSPSYPFAAQGCVLINLPSTPLMQWLAARQIPFVVQSNRTYDASRLPPHHGVCINKVFGGFEATRHLLGLGHRRIGFIGAVTDAALLHEVYEGVRSAMAVGGCDLRADDVLDLSTSESAMAVEPVRRFLARRDRPTALVAQNDAIALGALEASRQLKLSVPAELSLVGFDDLPEAGLSTPALTSVSNPRVLLGRTAVEMLLQAAEGRLPEPRRRILEGCLVVRESTAAPHEEPRTHPHAPHP